jgi:hypothetical protein
MQAQFNCYKNRENTSRITIWEVLINSSGFRYQSKSTLLSHILENSKITNHTHATEGEKATLLMGK